MTKLCPGSTIAREGFSLVEVLVALVILSIGILAVTSMAGSAVNQVRLGFNVTNSTLAAQQILDRYMMLPFDSLPVGSHADTVSLAGLNYTVVSTITDVSDQWTTESSNIIYHIVLYAGGGFTQRTGERFETYIYNPNGF